MFLKTSSGARLDLYQRREANDRDRLTRSTLFYLLCHNRKDIEHLHYYLHHDGLHRFSHQHLDIFLEPYEEGLDLLEDIDKYTVACNNVLCRLCGIRVRSLRRG